MSLYPSSLPAFLLPENRASPRSDVAAPRLAGAQREGFVLGHFFHGEADAFAAEAGVLHAAEGVAVAAEHGSVVDHDAAELELVEGAHGVFEARREHPGLKPVAAAVRDGDRLVEVLRALDDGDGAEDLFTRDARFGFDVDEDRRRDDPPLAAASREQARAVG